MPSPKRKRLLKKLIPYLIIWTVGGYIYIFLEYGILAESDTYPSTGNPYDPIIAIKAMFFLAIVLSLSIGLIEEGYFKNKLKNKSFLYRLIAKTIIYVSALSLIIVIFTAIVNGIIIDKTIFDEATIQNQLAFYFDVSFISILTYCSGIIAISLFISEMIDYQGLNVVGHFLTGKYAKPVVEDRIFMFLDMKGSTSIAEQLGHESYYRLVNQYYYDMTNAITDTEGEIYQYVGDEIVVSWRTDKGIINANCIRSYFQIGESIQANSDLYQREFGLVPKFKAGIHCGTVTRGQVGVIKKEMLFTGDALNTTARIQALCNELEAGLLISENIRSLLSEASLQTKSKGDFQLRGRNQTIHLYEVSSLDDQAR